MRKTNRQKCIFLMKSKSDTTDVTPHASEESFIRIDGNRVLNAKELMEVISQEMKFPAYFGWNWNALEECLSDLEWFPATDYYFWWDMASNLLVNSPRDFFMFLDIFASVSQVWDKKGKSFQIFIADDYIFTITQNLYDAISLDFIDSS